MKFKHLGKEYARLAIQQWSRARHLLSLEEERAITPLYVPHPPSILIINESKRK